MAEDDDGVSNKKSPQNSNNEASSQENEQIAAKPDLGIEEAKYNSNENGDTSPIEAKCSTSSEFLRSCFLFAKYKDILEEPPFLFQSRLGRHGRRRTRSRSGIS